MRVFGNNSIPGIDVTSGSLGHGLGIASGIALANRMNKLLTKIFVIISEGELYEGSTWEALLFLAHHKLTEIKIILDVNRNMILGRPEDHVGLESIDQKFKSFNAETMRIDGHHYQQIFDGLSFLVGADERPRVLIADTVKGKGVSLWKGDQSLIIGGLKPRKNVCNAKGFVSMNYQRDAFISELTERAKFDKDIVFLSADFGAPALDRFIAEFKRSIFHLGISEQNMIDVAIGLALRGKKVFAYAMAPFVVMRCAEQHKLAALL